MGGFALLSEGPVSSGGPCRISVNGCSVELAGWDSALVLDALVQLDLGFIHSGLGLLLPSVFSENLLILQDPGSVCVGL